MTGYRNHSRSPAPVIGRSNFPNVDPLWDATTGPGPGLGTPDTSRSVFQKRAVGIAQACQLFDDDVVAGHRYGAASKRPNFRQHLERRSESGDLRGVRGPSVRCRRRKRIGATGRPVARTDALGIRRRSDSGSTASPRRPCSHAFPSMALRHSYVTGALKAGVSPKIISERIGPNTDASR